MEITVKFEDNDHIYQVDLLKLLKKLGLTEDQVKRAAMELIAKS